MDYIHFHCKNCNSATPEMYNAQTISNITCIEELKKIINSNLITYIGYNCHCKNCNKIKSKLINIDNCEIINYYINGFRIYNNKLIGEYGLFRISHDEHYYRSSKYRFYSEISEKEFFDSIKVGSLLDVFKSASSIIDKIKKKFYQVNLIQIIDDYHYYLIERPTLTKPANKNNSSN